MTKFNISKIEIENFRSIQNKVTLDINPGLFSIEGQNYDEKCQNGAGKSTLVSALYWCLTGNALTNEVLADEVVNIKTGKDCKVVTYIDSDQGEIKITRTRKDSELGNSLSLEINGQNLSCHKLTDTQERLNQLLKIPFNLLHSTIIMTSDMKSAFSDLTPQQRIQTLESIRDYSIWDKVRDEANQNIKQYNKQISELNTNKAKLEGSWITYNDVLTKNMSKFFENGQKEATKEEINSLILLKDQQILENKQQIDKNNQEITLFRTKNVEIDTLLATKNVSETTLLATSCEITKEDLDKIIDEANKIKMNIQKLEYDKKDLEKELSVIEKWFIDDKCPTCKRLLDRTKEDIAEKNAQKEEINKKIVIINQNIENNNKSLQEKRTEWSLSNKKYQDYENNRKEIEKQKLQEIQNRVAEQNKAKKEIQDKIDKLSNENVRLEAINKQLENDKKELMNNEIYIEEISKIKNSIEEIKKQVDKLTNKRQLSEYFYKLLGSKGELRPYLLNKDIQYLNTCMQKYITRLFKNTSVNLVLNGATIDILIDSNGIKKNISSLSGGEKKRLNFAIQLALYDLVKSTSQVDFNVLWLDEVESQLDSLGCQQLIEIIEDKSEEISTVFWITNNPMVKENISNKIICVKKLGKTEVEYQ